jgi:hypothetical protein
MYEHLAGAFCSIAAPAEIWGGSYSEQKRKKARLMRTNIREMPSCVENVKNLLLPHLDHCMSGFQPLLFYLG